PRWTGRSMASCDPYAVDAPRGTGPPRGELSSRASRTLRALRRAAPCLGLGLLLYACAPASARPPPDAPAHPRRPLPPPLRPSAAPATLAISAVGDCTLGGDVTPQWQGASAFDIELKAHGDDLGYPFSGVLDVLAHDDLTIANLETTLTTAKERAPGTTFHFR